METAVSKLLNKLLLEANQRQVYRHLYTVSWICLLHSTLLILAFCSHTCSNAYCYLKWFRPYLSGRSHCMVVDGVSAKVICILCLVPRLGTQPGFLHPLHGGSGRGWCRTEHVSPRICWWQLNQLYIYCQPEDVQWAAFSVQWCVSVIEQWIAANWLRLNMDKTELMASGTKYNTSKIRVCYLSLTLGSAQVITFDTIHVLGMLLTLDLSLDKPVQSVLSACFSFSHPKFSRQQFISSMHSSPAWSVTVAVFLLVCRRRWRTWMQRVLSAVARIICNTHKYNWGMSRLNRDKFNWLDADDRVKFTLCVQVFKCVHNMVLEYLTSLCQPMFLVSGCQYLQSAQRGQLNYPCINLAMAYASPTTWNSTWQSERHLHFTWSPFLLFLPVHSAYLRCFIKMRYTSNTIIQLLYMLICFSLLPAQHYANTGISCLHVSVCLFVCPFVCLSQVCVLLKWLNVGSCTQCHMPAQEL